MTLRVWVGRDFGAWFIVPPYIESLRGSKAANDHVCPPQGPPPVVRPLDDLSVRRAEREFLKS